MKILTEISVILDKSEGEMLKKWAEDIRLSFNDKFFDAESKVYSTGSQTAMSMPYCMGIVNNGDRDKVFANLTDSIVSGNKALTAGDVGFHYLVEALTKGGASQLMFDMINRDDVPGYGFQLKKGATALTESWAALENVSNNHLMLGHVMEWFYAGLGGISQAENSVAYKEIEIQPEVVGDLTFVNVSFESPYGLIRSEWIKTDDYIDFEIEIPSNTIAKIYLLAKDVDSVNVDNPNNGIITKPMLAGKNKVSLEVASGIYKIRVQ